MTTPDERLQLAEEFAAEASVTGWTGDSLSTFCRSRNISPETQKVLWPRGVRSASWDLNDAADAQMLQAWEGRRPSLCEVLLQRFSDNEPLRASVAALARCDALHPLDTLSRTAQTAARMLRISGGDAGWVHVWLLTLSYSVAVLVWFADHSADRGATRWASRAAAFVAGG